MNVIDLFAGCGGLSRGFMDAGFDVIVGVDNDDDALNTFALNHHGAKTLNADLSKQETFEEIKRIAGNRPIDVIIAGPPCQGFSLTGPRNFDDERNKLYLAVMKIVNIFRPKGFVIENVPGMANLYNGQIKDEILKRFDSMGYNIDCKVLKACDYGVPQMRKRLIFMGIRKDIGSPRFPKPQFGPGTDKPYRTCRDAISDLPTRIDDLGKNEDIYSSPALTEYQKLMRGNCNVLHNHVATNHKEFVKQTIALVPEGGNYKDLPAGVGESRSFHMAWTRLNGNAPARTVDTGHRNLFHYELNRVPTVRESARIQSFPDEFVFTGTRTKQDRQVGNAVPPLLGKAIGESLLSIIGGQKNNNIKTLDLFAGCGGLCEGFEMEGHYETLACVEWEKAPCDNLRKHLQERWNMPDANKKVLRFDIQRTDELFEGWSDENYGTNIGLDAVVGDNPVDIIIGGPPCQAYSIAGRVRDEQGMKNDYRNFLFESYIKVVQHYKPKAFVFENVPGILSAAPTGEPIINVIKQAFDQAGYSVLPDLSKAVIDFSDYGVPQRRNRVIILGLRKEVYGTDANRILEEFYNTTLPSFKVAKKRTVRDAIGDLPKLLPTNEYRIGNKRFSHSFECDSIPNHEPRWHSKRDQDIFKLLGEDIESGRNKYLSTAALRQLYTEATGHESNVHKYHVIKWDEPSNLIPAHLYKDGLRHIHPDPTQARSITVREAARLQGFPDDYVFVGTQADAYKMIGNAVPPIFSKVLAKAIYQQIFLEEGE
ncbi:MAG: DNA cytosine methyltransferase [Erysipelotrichaceae bacterium]|nr:DNA cytosine methyltransferase [Erysipelotrichaceae bacterium]